MIVTLVSSFSTYIQGIHSFSELISTFSQIWALSCCHDCFRQLLRFLIILNWCLGSVYYWSWLDNFWWATFWYCEYSCPYSASVLVFSMEHTFTNDRICFYSISVERKWPISWFCWIWSICLLQAHWQITHSSPLDEVLCFNLGVPFASVFCPLLHPSRRKKNLNELGYGNLWSTNRYFWEVLLITTWHTNCFCGIRGDRLSWLECIQTYIDLVVVAFDECHAYLSLSVIVNKRCILIENSS